MHSRGRGTGIRELAVAVSGNSVRGWQFRVGCVGQGTGNRSPGTDPGTGCPPPQPVMHSRGGSTGIRDLAVPVSGNSVRGWGMGFPGATPPSQYPGTGCAGIRDLRSRMGVLGAPPPPEPVSGNRLCKYPGIQFADGSSRVGCVGQGTGNRYPGTVPGTGCPHPVMHSRGGGTGIRELGGGIRELSSRMGFPGGWGTYWRIFKFSK